MISNHTEGIQRSEIWLFPGFAAVTGCMASDWHPEQRQGQNRETANIGLDSSVGGAPFRSHSSQILCSIKHYFKIYQVNFSSGPYLIEIYICSCFTAMDCTFETGFCNFIQLQDDNFDWVRLRGSTGSTHTGPDEDHTTGSGLYKICYFL